MSLTTVLLFLKTYWKQIAGAALIGFCAYAINQYLNSVYNKGRESGIADTTKEWKEKYERDVGILNAKIADVEIKSKQNADQAKIDLTTANDKISQLQEDLRKQRSKYDSYVYNQSGKIVCKTDGPIYLGSEFSIEWNMLNKEIVK